MVELLKQDQYQPYSLSHEVMSIYAGTSGHLDDIEVLDVRRFEKAYLKMMDERYPDVGLEIEKNKALTDELTRKMDEAITAFKKEWRPVEAR